MSGKEPAKKDVVLSWNTFHGKARDNGTAELVLDFLCVVALTRSMISFGVGYLGDEVGFSFLLLCSSTNSSMISCIICSKESVDKSLMSWP